MYSTVTIIFISSLRILYEKWSDDPIFPADEPWSVPGDSKRWFRNSDPRARPLACINKIETCAPDGSSCWSIRAPDNITNIKWTPDYTLLYASLYHTDIFDSIKKRLGRGLLAQKMVSGYFSDALSNYHWVDEMENLVATAHARTQINAWSVASGEDSVHEGRDGYYSVTEKYGNLCKRYKYNPQGYVSLHYTAFIIISIWTPLLWFLTLDANPLEKRVRSWFKDIVSACKNTILRLRALRSGSRGDNQSSGARQPRSISGDQEEIQTTDTGPTAEETSVGSTSRPLGVVTTEDDPESTQILSELPPTIESTKTAGTKSQLWHKTDSRDPQGSETDEQALSEDVATTVFAAESSRMAASRPRAGSDMGPEIIPDFTAEEDVEATTRQRHQSHSEEPSVPIIQGPENEVAGGMQDPEIKWEPLLYWDIGKGFFWALGLLLCTLPGNLIRYCTGGDSTA
jgi:hypothetical protein